MSAGVLDVAVLGDLHGHFALAADAPLLAPYALRLCTGDLTPNAGRDRFDDAIRQARELREAGVLTILGNHDGPTAFTGRSFPKSYEQLEEALGGLHVGGRRVDLPDLDVSLVGARPLSCGGPEIRFPVPGREDWTMERWADEIVSLVLGATCSRVVVLAHDGPTGLGATASAPYGCDFRAEEGDWGDLDLRLALDRLRDAGAPVVAVLAGHMHHGLRFGGERTSVVREGGVLHVNAAVVPRVSSRGRALTVLSLEGAHATARQEWHASDGTASVDALA